MNKSMLNTTALKIAFLLMLYTASGFGQDLIIRRDSSKIFCKINHEDSLNIYYISAKEKQKAELSINKTEVLKCHGCAVKRSGGTSNIYLTKSFNRGFYKSYYEYITNSPSVVKDVTAVERDKAELILTHGSLYAYKVDGQTVINGDYYGFCDGKDVYINYDHPRGYCKIEGLGHFTYFTYTVHGLGVFALIPEQLMVIDERGKFKDANVKYVRKLLMEKHPELAAKYETEADKKGKRREYLIKLNEYLISKK